MPHLFSLSFILPKLLASAPAWIRVLLIETGKTGEETRFEGSGQFEFSYRHNGLPWGSAVKKLSAVQDTRGFSPLGKERATHSSIPVFGKSHEQRSLVGYRPWDLKELNTS